MPKNVHKCPSPLDFAHMVTTSGCNNFNNYFLDAQSDLLYILTPSCTPEQDQAAALS